MGHFKPFSIINVLIIVIIGTLFVFLSQRDIKLILWFAQFYDGTKQVKENLTSTSSGSVSTSTSSSEITSLPIIEKAWSDIDNEKSGYVKDEILVKFRSTFQGDPKEHLKNTFTKILNLDRKLFLNSATGFYKFGYIKDSYQVADTQISLSQGEGLQKESINLIDGIENLYQFKLKTRKEILDETTQSFPESYSDMTQLNNVADSIFYFQQELSRWYKVKLKGAFDPFTLAELLQESDPFIEVAEPNYIVKTFDNSGKVPPNDPYYHSKGNTLHPGIDDMWGLKAIQGEEGWKIEQGSPSIIVAVSDTGVNLSHPELKDKIWINTKEIPNDGKDNDNNGFIDDINGWDFADNDNNPEDEHFHGTHVAGTIAAVTNNNRGVASVCWNCKIMALNFLGKYGSGTTINGAFTILYAVNNGARVINMSWGAAGYYSQYLDDVLNYADSKGVVLVAAAGNSSQDARFHSPANHPKVITVSATEYGDRLAGFSNVGTKIDIGAPGENILSLRALNGRYICRYPEYTLTSEYCVLSGTSMAAPHVSGAAALLISKNPALKPHQVRSILRASADDIAPVGRDEKFGYGRLNLKRALEMVSQNVIGSAKIEVRLNEELVLPNTAMVIKGYASAVDFSKYDIFWGKGPFPQSWNTTGIVVNNGGLSPVENGQLAIWNVPKDLSNGEHTLRLRVFTKKGVLFEDQVTIFVGDNTIVWRKPTAIVFFPRGFIADINKDGKKEFVYRDYGESKKDNKDIEYALVNAIDENGNSLPGWPVKLPDNVITFTAISAGDLDGDGKLETIVLGYKLFQVVPESLPFLEKVGTFIFKSNGQPFHSNNKPLLTLGHYYPYFIKDINKDGKDEMITVDYFYRSTGGRLTYVVDKELNALPFWPRTKPNSVFEFNPLIVDLDLDGYSEIVQVIHRFINWHIENLEKVEARDYRGKRYSDFSSSIKGNNSFGWTSTDLKAGDIDGDGLLDVIWSYRERDFSYRIRKDHLIVSRYDGTEMFRITRDRPSFGPYSLGDLNGDGQVDIVMVNYFPTGEKDEEGNEIYEIGIEAFTNNGVQLPGFPIRRGVDYYFTDVWPVLGDLNGDGQVDILVSIYDSLHRRQGLMAFDNKGKAIAGWPKLFSRPYERISNWYDSPIITDFDNDGMVDIIAPTSAFIYRFELPYSYKETLVPWPMAGHDYARSNVLMPSKKVSSPPTRPVINNQSPPSVNKIESFSSSSKPRAGEKIKFIIRVYSYDPDYDWIKLKIDWGDGSIEETDYQENLDFTVYHSWLKAGKYRVSATVADELGATSSKKFSSSEFFIYEELPSPSGLICDNATSKKVKVSWNEVDNASGYEVEYRYNDSSGNEKVKTASTSNNTYIISSCLVDKIYNIKVRATSGSNKPYLDSPWSNSIECRCRGNAPPGNQPPNTPTLPSGLSEVYAGHEVKYTSSAKDPEGDQVKLKFDWSDNTFSETSLAPSGASLSASHIWNKPGVYKIKVKATDEWGAESGYSNYLTVKVLPGKLEKPTNLRCDNLPRKLKLSWDAVNNADKYKIEYGYAGKPYTKIVNAGTSFTFSCSAGKTYNWKVQAINSKNYYTPSDWSNLMWCTCL